MGQFKFLWSSEQGIEVHLVPQICNTSDKVTYMLCCNVIAQTVNLDTVTSLVVHE